MLQKGAATVDYSQTAHSPRDKHMTPPPPVAEVMHVLVRHPYSSTAAVGNVACNSTVYNTALLIAVPLLSWRRSDERFHHHALVQQMPDTASSKCTAVQCTALFDTSTACLATVTTSNSNNTN
jgi:hypothetical protein